MKKSFVMTGFVRRSTCNCGCCTDNYFHQDGGFGGTAYLAMLHPEIEKFMDELSGARAGGHGDPCDVKVTITIETLGTHNHQILNRREFTGFGFGDNEELKKKIMEPSEPVNETVLEGDVEFKRDASREVSATLLQDIHDRLLLVERTNDVTKLQDVMVELRRIIADQKC
jgi:hypothetical protein